MLRLDLGSGREPAPGFLGVDRLSSEGVVAVDLCDGAKWPWDDASVDELRAHHFIEHIPATEVFDGCWYRDALFWFFDEAWRVAKPSALFDLRWPHHQSVWAWQDPTHRRCIPAQMLSYLSRDGRDLLRVSSYHVSCNWVVVGEKIAVHGNEADGPLEYAAVLRKEM